MAKYRLIKDPLCDDCEKVLGHYEGYWYIEDGDDNYCPDCALKRGLITPDQWARGKGFCVHHATYENGVVTLFRKWGRGFTKENISIGTRDEVKNEIE